MSSRLRAIARETVSIAERGAPYRVTFLTAAAPNHGQIVRNQPEHAAAVPEILHRRAGRVLVGHRHLGAFADQLAPPRGFEQVIFAVLDRQRGTPTYAAFAEALR